MDAVLHIGFGKCGSSALQSALSAEPVRIVKDSKYNQLVYVGISHGGEVLSGEALSEKAQTNHLSYVNGCGLYSENTLRRCETIRQQLRDLSDEGRNLLVLSCEAFAGKIDYFSSHALFEKLGLNAKVVCYVRNPVEWVNSAWWQWGAWMENEQSLNSYVKRITPSQWATILKKWQNYLGVDKVQVRLLPKDIVSDFYALLGEEPLLEQQNNVNTSLPEEVLRFFQMHRELRPHPHVPKMDFILAEVLDFDEKYHKTPWVMTEEHISYILHETYDSNRELVEMMDEVSAEKCLNDRRWWHEDAFAQKHLAPEGPEGILTDKVLSHMLLTSFHGIRNLYEEKMKLKKELLKKRKGDEEELTDKLCSLAFRAERRFDIATAAELMKIAHRRRPEGPVIRQKCEEYEYLLKMNKFMQVLYRLNKKIKYMKTGHRWVRI